MGALYSNNKSFCYTACVLLVQLPVGRRHKHGKQYATEPRVPAHVHSWQILDNCLTSCCSSGIDALYVTNAFQGRYLERLGLQKALSSVYLPTGMYGVAEWSLRVRSKFMFTTGVCGQSIERDCFGDGKGVALKHHSCLGRIPGHGWLSISRHKPSAAYTGAAWLKHKF